nr:hypothetical protein [Pseudomonas aromaticivorans]
MTPSPQTPKVIGDLAGGQLRVGNHRLQALQPFQLEEAMVLGREDYRFDRGAQVSPTDLALGWGPMADPGISRQIEIRQSNRWYYWRADELPIPRREIERHSTNMHMIPASAAVAAMLDSLQKGARIRLSGQLVRVDGDDGFRWVSSLSREDTGNGACELVWVEQLAVLP